MFMVRQLNFGYRYRSSGYFLAEWPKKEITSLDSSSFYGLVMHYSWLKELVLRATYHDSFEGL